MAIALFDDTVQGAAFVVCMVTLPICTLLTVLRFSPSRRRSGSTGLEDLFAVGAWISYLIYATIVLIILFLVHGHGLEVLTLSQFHFATKLVYVNSLFNWTNQLCAKLSILLLYRRVFSVKNAYRWAIYTIAVIHIGLIIASILVALFGCHPIAKGWNPALPGWCITTAPHPYLAGTESVNSAIDFAMVILAMIMIRDLNMSLANKLRLSVLFILGGLAGVIGFVKIGEFYATGGGKKSRDLNFILGLYTVVQDSCSIICCCAPIYKSIIFPSIPIFTRLASSTASFWEKTIRSVSSKRSLRSHHVEEKGGSAGPRAMDVENGHAIGDWVLLDGSSRKHLAPADLGAKISSNSNRSAGPPYTTLTPLHHKRSAQEV
ncbi:hypothetical protein GGS21DRAFT_184336 [Xylaria nigripes]|nr:hypothetical protein GGS21DRAFT_184336 [Xylaria nigripes]